MKLVAFVISGVLFYLSIGAGHVWPLAWIAPVPLLVIALAATSRRDVVVAGSGAAMAMAIGLANLVVLYLGVLPVIALVPIVAIVAPSYGLAVAWFAMCARRSRPLAVIGFAATWTAWEWITSLVSPHGTAGSIAYSQGNVPWILHAAALAGQYAITFALCLVPAALAVFAHDRRRVWGLVVAASVFAALGGAWLLDPPEREAVVRVGLAASDGDRSAVTAESREEAVAPLPGYEAAVARAASEGATIVVLPERITTLRPAWRAELEARLQQLARAQRLDLVVGLGDFSSDPPRNVAAVYRANGERFTYAKHHLIPGIEAPFAPGSSTLRFDGAGIAICKDLDFQDTARENAGARVLFVPAWDFTSDAELHRRMAVMRGVEGGFALVRSARDGYLSVHDAWGRLLAEKRSSAEAVALAIVDVPVIARHPPMLATELGIAMIVIALGCGVLVVRGSRPRR